MIVLAAATGSSMSHKGIQADGPRDFILPHVSGCYIARRLMIKGVFAGERHPDNQDSYDDSSEETLELLLHLDLCSFTAYITLDGFFGECSRWSYKESIACSFILQN
jgi:hypothetical protein